MIPISQRLRARLEPIGDGSGKWRPDGLCQEAADTIDALVAALEKFAHRVPRIARSQPPYTLVATAGIELELFLDADAALAKAKGKQE